MRVAQPVAKAFPRTLQPQGLRCRQNSGLSGCRERKNPGRHARTMPASLCHTTIQVELHIQRLESVELRKVQFRSALLLRNTRGIEGRVAAESAPSERSTALKPSRTRSPLDERQSRDGLREPAWRRTSPAKRSNGW